MLTPIDINDKKFRRVFFGYSKLEVEEFLNEVINDYEQIFKENKLLTERIELLGDTVSHYKTIESTIQGAMVSAQTASEDLKRNAKDEARNIVQAAENKANEILTEAYKRVTQVQGDYENIKKDFNIYRLRVSNLLSSQLEALKSDVRVDIKEQTEEQEQENQNVQDTGEATA